MAAQKGKDVLIKVDNSGTYQTIGGLRSSSITLNDEAVDITNKSSNGYRELLAGGGVNSISISGSGVFTDSATEGLLKDMYLAQQNIQVDGSTAQTAAFRNLEFFIPQFFKFRGKFMIESLEYAGEYNGEATYSVTFQSSGIILITAFDA
jgi:TP901-1 family phage major tail protein